MLNVRFREKTNAWPGFVDLFSNLVIILIFLLIVFVFLWTTTSVFNHDVGAKKVAELQKTQQEQAERIVQMTADSEQADQLLVAARNVLENKDAEIQTLSNNYEQQLADLNTTYQQQMYNLSQEQAKLAEQIAQLTEKLKESDSEKQILADQEAKTRDEIFSQANSEIQTLNARITELQEQLKRAEDQAKQQDIEYIEMSNRLNKALADKIAELNKLSEYQSEFYKQVKNALGDRTTIQQDGDRFIVSSDILFPSGSYRISENGKSQLRLLANIIKDFEDKIPTDINWIIRVDGHTDNKAVMPGTVGYKNNMQLSLLRATAVTNELVKNGVSKRRLVPSGFGELHPVALGDDKDSLQKNRRIELQLTNK